MSKYVKVYIYVQMDSQIYNYKYGNLNIYKLYTHDDR